MTALSPRQLDALRAIAVGHALHSYPPTMREVAAALGVTVKAVGDLMATLVRKGALHYHPFKTRSAVPTESGREALCVAGGTALLGAPVPCRGGAFFPIVYAAPARADYLIRTLQRLRGAA